MTWWYWNVVISWIVVSFRIFFCFLRICFCFWMIICFFGNTSRFSFPDDYSIFIYNIVIIVINDRMYRLEVPLLKWGYPDLSISIRDELGGPPKFCVLLILKFSENSKMCTFDTRLEIPLYLVLKGSKKKIFRRLRRRKTPLNPIFSCFIVFLCIISSIAALFSDFERPGGNLRFS